MNKGPLTMYTLIPNNERIFTGRQIGFVLNISHDLFSSRTVEDQKLNKIRSQHQHESASNL